MKFLTEVYPPTIKPVRDGMYLAMPEYFRFGTKGLEGYSLWRFSDGEWRHVNDEAYKNPMYWVGLAFDPESAEPVDKLDDSVLATPGHWIPEVSDD